MRERPILFSAPMVRAILAGTKTQTRRVMAPQPQFDGVLWNWGKAAWSTTPICAPGHSLSTRCPFGVRGDRLWVRETWRAVERESDGTDGVLFADGAFVPIRPTREAADAWLTAYDNGRHGARWRPSIYMPRWASRITLEVTEVRVERLQSVSTVDAMAEGVDPHPTAAGVPSYTTGFHRLWDAINGKRASWDSNPWVWVVGFKRVEVRR